MKREIYGLWYKHNSNLITTPSMALMKRKEGIESYGLYMHFADTLHSVGGFIKYDFNDICLMLGYTKKNIKEKLNRVLNDYDLFDFIEDEDGVEMIGLQRLRNDIESLAKHKINGAKGGKKRAENLRKKQGKIISEKEAVKQEQPLKLPDWFLEQPLQKQKETISHMESQGIELDERGNKMKKMMIDYIKSKETY